MRYLNTAAFAATFLLLLTPSANADVYLYASDDGKNLTLHYKGTMQITGEVGEVDHDETDESLDILTTNRAISVSGKIYRDHDAGALKSTVFPGRGGEDQIASSQNLPSIGTGTGFGISGKQLWWAQSLGKKKGALAIDRKWTVSGRTVTSQFDNSLDKGPVLLWSHNKTGSKIFVSRLYYIKAGGDLYLSYKTGDTSTLPPVVLAKKDDANYTTLQFGRVNVQDKYQAFQILNAPTKGESQWLGMGDANHLQIDTRSEAVAPSRAYFKMGDHNGGGKFLEAMWVNAGNNAAAAVVANPDHDYFLTHEAKGGETKEKIHSIPHTEDPKTNPKTKWELVPAGR